MLADLGCADLKWHDERIQWKQRPTDVSVHLCTIQYRPPDMLLGSLRFGPDLDLWALGCVAAELLLREPLFNPKRTYVSKERHIFATHLEILGTPPRGSSTYAWMASLPLFEKFYKERLPAPSLPVAPESSPRLPGTVGIFRAKNIAVASPRTTDGCISQPTRVLELARPLRECICRTGQQKGPSSIAQGNLDDDVLEYLQNCPSWERWHAELRSQFTQNHGIGHEEVQLGMKSEGQATSTRPSPHSACLSTAPRGYRSSNPSALYISIGLSGVAQRYGCIS